MYEPSIRRTMFHGSAVGRPHEIKENKEMPIVAVFDFPGEEIAKYHKVFEIGGDPIREQPERLDHLCYETESGFTVVDIWTDEAAFARFGEVIGPATAAAGLEAKPVVHPLVGTVDAAGDRTVY